MKLCLETIFPLVVEFNQETAQKIFLWRNQVSLAASFPQLLRTSLPRLDIAKAIAKDHKEMLFVTINTDEKDHKRIMEFLS